MCGGYCLTIDYRAVSAKANVPLYLVPVTDWVLAQFGKARRLTITELSQGFFQIPFPAEDVAKTAFLCP